MFLANGKFNVFRGESTDDYGDSVDDPTLVHTDELGSVIEGSRRVYDPSSSRVDTVRFLTGRFKNGTDIIDGDRLEHTVTGKKYVVSAVLDGNSPVHKSDLVLDLIEAN